MRAGGSPFSARALLFHLTTALEITFVLLREYHRVASLSTKTRSVQNEIINTHESPTNEVNSEIARSDQIRQGNLLIGMFVHKMQWQLSCR